MKYSAHGAHSYEPLPLPRARHFHPFKMPRVLFYATLHLSFFVASPGLVTCPILNLPTLLTSNNATATSAKQPGAHPQITSNFSVASANGPGRRHCARPSKWYNEDFNKQDCLGALEWFRLEQGCEKKPYQCNKDLEFMSFDSQKPGHKPTALQVTPRKYSFRK